MREILFRGKRVDNKLVATQKYRKTKKGVITNLYNKMKERNHIKNFGDLPFTLIELQEKYLNDETFNRIYEKWEISNYDSYEKPSFDRINPLIGYTLDNIKITNWKCNREKGDYEKSFIYTTAIVMCDVNGNKIREFESTKECSNVTGVRQSSITACCQGKYKTAGGYIFKYRGDKFRCKNKKLIGNIFDEKE